MDTPSQAGDASDSISRKSFSQDVTEKSASEEHRSTRARAPLSIEEGEQVMGELPSVEIFPGIEDEHKLQDQTRLLPFKQLLVVSVGLSCALFCKRCSTACGIYVHKTCAA